MRPPELRNTTKSKKELGQKAGIKIARRILGVDRPEMSHAEVVKKFCVPLSDEDRERREDFAARVGSALPQVALYYADLSKFDIRQQMFLQAFAESGLVREACLAAKVSRGTVETWLKESEHFRAMYDEAEEDATDDLESHAITRAKSNSDALMIMMLKARRPEKYGDKVLQGNPKKGRDLTPQEWTIGEMVLKF